MTNTVVNALITGVIGVVVFVKALALVSRDNYRARVSLVMMSITIGRNSSINCRCGSGILFIMCANE